MDFVNYSIGKKLQEKGYPHGYNRFGYRGRQYGASRLNWRYQGKRCCLRGKRERECKHGKGKPYRRNLR